jgi:hypothetical protein
MTKNAAYFLTRFKDFLHRVQEIIHRFLNQDKQATRSVQLCNATCEEPRGKCVVFQVVRDYDFLPCPKCGGVAVWEGFNAYDFEGFDTRNFCFRRIVFASFYACRCGWRSGLELRWFKLPIVKRGRFDFLLG